MTGCHAATVTRLWRQGSLSTPTPAAATVQQQRVLSASAPAMATVRQGSLSAPVPAAATVQQQGALSASAPAARSDMGGQQITLQYA